MGAVAERLGEASQELGEDRPRVAPRPVESGVGGQTGGVADAAILTSGASRWYNFYVEGINWLARNVPIDGLYLDDVAYDGRILKRVRKVLDRARRGCLIDLHSNTLFSIGPANQYTEFFPYVNRLWFGEGGYQR